MIRLSEIISALSYALDLTEGQPVGHAVRSCLLGMKLADQLGLSSLEKSQLYYAILLKDTGCSSNAARVYQIFGTDDHRTKRDLKTTDWTRTIEGLKYVRRNAAIGQSLFQRAHRIVTIAAGGSKDAAELVQTRCDRGAIIARTLGFSEATASAIYSLDEHWNGRGHPEGLKGEKIPLFARILSLCQTLEVFASSVNRTVAFQVIQERSGRWFDPELVRAAKSLENDHTIWDNWETDKARALLMALEPAGDKLLADEAHVSKVCEGFAAVIDAKSPWTHHHSQGVTAAATGIAGEMGLSAKTITMIRQAALLHDIGKLSISNAILDKPGKLTAEEFSVVRRHPVFTQRIVEKVKSFHELAYVASSHHEKLDGSGYFRSLDGNDLSIPARILAVADIYDALSANRPYRPAMPPEKVFQIIARESPGALCPDCVEGLQKWAA